MKNFEKKVFWKFFLIYFISVALLIIIAGYFYYHEQKNFLISKEQFSLIWFARMLKVTDFKYQKDEFEYKILKKKIKNFHPMNLKITECCFEKVVPNKHFQGYILVKKSKNEFEKKLKDLTKKIAFVQILLLFLFGLLSFFLAKMSIKPIL